MLAFIATIPPLTTVGAPASALFVEITLSSAKLKLFSIFPLFVKAIPATVGDQLSASLCCEILA